jgi:hypothetical protein
MIYEVNARVYLRAANTTSSGLEFAESVQVDFKDIGEVANMLVKLHDFFESFQKKAKETSE